MKFIRPNTHGLSRFLHIAIFAVVICLFQNTYAQDSSLLNSVRIELKSGMIIEGKLVSIDYQNQVEIRTPIGENLIIAWDDMAELSFIDNEIEKHRLQTRRLIRPQKEYGFNDSSTFFSFEFGTPFGVDFWGDPVMGGTLQMAYGKSFDYKNSLALVTGFEFYLWPDMTFIPIGLEYRGRVQKEGFSWFYYLQAGYGMVPWSEYTSDWLENSSAKGGLYVNPGVGITKKTHPKRSWYFKFGYKSQTASAEYDSHFWNLNSVDIVRVKERIRYHRVDMRFGLRFN